MTKAMKNEIKEIWIDQIKTAIYAANQAVKFNSEDNGTCNFDMCMVQRESKFTYQETIEIFKECGLPARKMGGYDKGYIGIPNFEGQANRNTRWAEAFAKSLKRQGFKTSMYYQVD